jgi:steroid delta-isomerase-like uncharacterized protein
MPAEENKAIERRIFQEILDKHNLAMAGELIDANWVYHAADGQDVKGLEGFRQFHNMLFAAFPDMNFEVEDMIAEGDKVVVSFIVSGTHSNDFLGVPPTGRKMRVKGIAIHRLDGGKEVEVWDVVDHYSMMQQLGIISPAG